MNEGVEILFDQRAILGEGPVWLDREKRICWVDITGCKVHLLDPATGEHREIDTGQPIGAIVPAEDGRMVCAMKEGFYYLDPAAGTFEPIADPESGLANNRFNDGKCDRSGRFWAGTMPMTEDHPGGALYALNGDGLVQRKLEGITCSNGLCWSPDNKTMYYIDTHTHKVDRLSYDAETGSISGRETALTIPKELGLPDGMTIDAEGMLWIALWGGFAVTRWNPETGEQIGRVDIPAALVTSCCFGGDDWDELYITTASIGQSEEELRDQPHAGCLFRYKPGVKGFPTDYFKPAQPRR